MPTSDSLDTSASLVLQASRLIRILRRHSSYQIPAASVRLLSLVDEYKSAAVKHLAAIDQCSQPTMTGLVNGAVERGWLRRQQNPSDARSSLVSLTSAGREQLAEARVHHAMLIQSLAERANVGTEDLSRAVDVLEGIVRAFPTPHLNSTESRSIPC